MSDESKRVLVFILEFQKVHGRKPLWKEMLDGLGISNGALRKHMNRLEKAGELRLEYVSPRTNTASAR